MTTGCPGAASLKGAREIKLKTCPECGAEIEIFSGDISSACRCGFIAYADTPSCVMWCARARECVGDAIYEEYKRRIKKNERS